MFDELWLSSYMQVLEPQSDEIVSEKISLCWPTMHVEQVPGSAFLQRAGLAKPHIASCRGRMNRASIDRERCDDRWMRPRTGSCYRKMDRTSDCFPEIRADVQTSRAETSDCGAKTIQRSTNHDVGARCSTKAAVLSASASSQCKHTNKNPGHATPCSNPPRFMIPVVRACVPEGLAPLVVRAYVRYALGRRRLQG
jgi:hypothetical protein